MTEVVDFVCLRIQSELDRYIRTKTLPHDLMEGTYTVEDIKKCSQNFSKKHQRAANKLITQYSESIKNNLSSIRTALKKDYSKTMLTLRTTDVDFMFPSVLIKYRHNINPVLALYYESREAVRTYNPENEYKLWIVELISDREFNNRLIDALSTDIKRLDRIIQRYYWPLTVHDKENIPLELFHARQLIKDFKHCITHFQSVLSWNPDE